MHESDLPVKFTMLAYIDPALVLYIHISYLDTISPSLPLGNLIVELIVPLGNIKTSY